MAQDGTAQHETGLRASDGTSAKALLADSRRRHYLKKLLLSKEIEGELALLNDPKAVEHFGHPFRPAPGSRVLVTPQNTELPVLGFVFRKFVTTFPFLANTNQDAFWQDKVQVFLETFASKRISSSEDRAESSKRAKLAGRIRSMLVLLMNAGIHAGKEESISIDEVEQIMTTESVKNLEINASEGKMIHGLDLNVAGVRVMQRSNRIRRREHHSEFLIRTRRPGLEEVFVARRYGAFKRLQAQLREEFPGKQIPRLPMKNKAPSSVSSYMPSMPTFGFGGGSKKMVDGQGQGQEDEDEEEEEEEDSGESAEEDTTVRQQHATTGYRRSTSSTSTASVHSAPAKIPREKQRLTLRSYLRRIQQDQQIARSTALRHFLLDRPIKLTEAEERDCRGRRDLDALRQLEQLKFLEVARDRAKALDAHMDVFKRQLIQENGLSKIFAAIRECETIEDLPDQYIKVIEWGRIEVAATLYQLFVADDNSSELFTQAKRIHGLFPYAVLKNIMRFSNPMTMMRAGIDLFLATPFGRASLFQRMFSSGLSEDIRDLQASIDALRVKIDDEALCERLRNFVLAREDQQAIVRLLAQEDEVDLIVSIMRNSEVAIEPALDGPQISKVFRANVAWLAAIDGVAKYNLKDAQLFGYFSQLLKLYTRQRDKEQMMAILFAGATSNLLKDMVAIFYEPLARVYKAASIHHSIMDFSRFAEDVIQTVKEAEEQDLSTNPSALVQTFIDLTARHQNAFYHFVHEAHNHDGGLFDGLMSWIELILTFLREGAAEHVQLEQIFDAIPDLDRGLAVQEIDACVAWNGKMKVWRHERMQKKMAAEQQQEQQQQSSSQAAAGQSVPLGSITGADFGLDQNDLDEMLFDEQQSEGEEEMEEAIDNLDPLEAEIRRKKRDLARLQRRYGEPEMPQVTEVYKLSHLFKEELRRVLAATP